LVFSFIIFSFALRCGGGLDDIETLLKTDPDQARALLSEACADPAEEGRARYLLCLLANREGDAAGALVHGKRLVALQPESSEAHLQYAIAMRNKFFQSKWYAITHVSEYKQHLARALILDIRNFTAWHEKIVYLMYAPAIAGGSAKKARAALDELKRLNADQALFVTAMIHARDGRQAEALESFEQVVLRDGGNTGAHFGAAFALIGLGRYREAAERFQSIYDQDAGQLSALFQACRARVLGGFEAERALAGLDIFIERCSHNLLKQADALYFQARALHQCGREAEAREALRRCLARDPDHKAAAKGLGGTLE